MRVIATKTFAGKMGLIRGGSIITVDDRYAQQLISNKLALRHEGPDPDMKALGGAPENKDLGGAPSNKGEGDVGGNERSDDRESTSSQDQEPGKAGDSSAGQPAAGRMPPVSSRQVGRRSRKKT